LAPIDRHALPDRSYYLTTGPVTTATELRYPGDDGWRNLDLFWPDDRQWFIRPTSTSGIESSRPHRRLHDKVCQGE